MATTIKINGVEHGASSAACNSPDPTVTLPDLMVVRPTDVTSLADYKSGHFFSSISPIRVCLLKKY